MPLRSLTDLAGDAVAHHCATPHPTGANTKRADTLEIIPDLVTVAALSVINIFSRY